MIDWLQRARSLLSHSLLWDCVNPNQVEEFQPEFALSLHIYLMVDAFIE
jgi:hypothetical protein